MNMNEQMAQVQPIEAPNAFMEKLLELRSTKPKDFALISPNMRLSLLYYEAGRREHLRLEAMKASEA